MTNKLVFLDFDGVLNDATLKLARVCHRKVCRELFHPHKIILLSNLLSSTGADVVISSMWRQWNSLRSIKNALADAGLEGEVIGRTPWLNDNRGHEVSRYLRDYTQTYGSMPRYVIFDDKADPTLFRHGKSFIHTDSVQGLQPAHIAIAKNVLSGGRR